MELRFLAPVNCQREGAGETHHIQERNHQEGLRVCGMHFQGIEAAHGDRSGNTNHENQHTQSATEPADAAMPWHVVRSHQPRLQQEE